MGYMDDRTEREDILLGLAQLQRYLGDEAAPMMVADAIQPLITEPPEIVLPVIQDWITNQRRVEGGRLTVGDCLYHAVERIFFLSQLQLIDRAMMVAYARRLAQLALEVCPAEERDLLRQRLARLGKQHAAAGASAIEIQDAPGGRRGGMPAGEQKRQRRFTMLVDRLRNESGEEIKTRDDEGGSEVSLRDRVVAASAMGARSEDEFERYRHQLAESGVDARTEEVIRSLAETLPGWVLPEDAEQTYAGPDWQKSHALDAMRRVVTGPDVVEGSRRFGELVEAAIKRFNAGSLPQAHKMFRLAQGLADEKKVSQEVLKSLKSRASGAFIHEQLMRAAEDTRRRHLLRHILQFFDEFQIPGLLAELAAADVKDRRRLLLVLLEVHGKQARPAILAALKACLADSTTDVNGWFQRNLVFLLRRIPREEGVSPDEELALLVRLLDPDLPTMVVIESVGAAGQIRMPAAERALCKLLSSLEVQLPDADEERQDELMTLMDRTVAAMARHGSASCIDAVWKHATEKRPDSASAFLRLAELAATDLSPHESVMQRLLDGLRKSLPGGIMGLLRGTSGERVGVLIRALSGTTSEAVLTRLAEVAERHPDEEFGEQAARAVHAMKLRSDPRRASGPGLAGDLDLFGLSDLLQTLAGSQHTGTLRLLDQDTLEMGVMTFVEGKLAAATAGPLTGQEAVYQLFERPAEGSFTFRSGNREQLTRDLDGAEVMEVMPLVMEAIRRHDELQHADVLVPDDLRPVPGEGKPSRPEHEEDRDFLRNLWKLILSGATPSKCERELGVDSFRVKCAVAHWLEEGSLRPAQRAA